jgi:hypothetical protein
VIIILLECQNNLNPIFIVLYLETFMSYYLFFLVKFTFIIIDLNLITHLPTSLFLLLYWQIQLNFQDFAFQFGFFLQFYFYFSCYLLISPNTKLNFSFSFILLLHLNRYLTFDAYKTLVKFYRSFFNIFKSKNLFIY